MYMYALTIHMALALQAMTSSLIPGRVEVGSSWIEHGMVAISTLDVDGVEEVTAAAKVMGRGPAEPHKRLVLGHHRQVADGTGRSYSRQRSRDSITEYTSNNRLIKCSLTYSSYKMSFVLCQLQHTMF